MVPCLENGGNSGGLGLKLFSECLAEAILKGSDLTASTETEGDRIVEYCLPVCTRRTSEGLGSDLCLKKLDHSHSNTHDKIWVIKNLR